MLGNFWKLYAGKFLETICWEIFRNYMLEKFFETICWEIFGIHMMVTS